MKIRGMRTLILLCVSVFMATANASEQTAWVNANGYTITADGKLVQFSQMYIEDDKVVAIGDAISIPEGTDVIDVQGQTLLPGLIDAHGHILGLGQGLFEIDLRGPLLKLKRCSELKTSLG